MQPHWIEFTDGTKASCEGDSPRDAMDRAFIATGKTARAAHVLPYPATPVIRHGDSSDCPAFCYKPESCKGRTSCPRDYACSE